MQLINEKKKGRQFLLRVNDIYSEYTCVVPLKDKKGITMTNSFQKIHVKTQTKKNMGR